MGQLTNDSRREDRKPLIGLASLHRQRERIEAYADAVTRAGGVPVALVCFGPAATSEIVDRMDAVVFMGGGDVEPAAYGAAEKATVGVDPDRDQFELELVRAALDADRPVLAVCRGIQLLNVALGGTLHQDLPTWDGLDPHTGFTDAETPEGTLHEVHLLPGSRTATAAGQETVRAWSSYHQAVDRLGAGLRPVGWSRDGLVEAVEGEEGWVVGVQWHPETTAHADPVQQAIYGAFVAQARESARCRGTL